MSFLIALNIAVFSLYTHAKDTSGVAYPASAWKVEASGNDLKLNLEGKNVATFECQFSNPLDYDIMSRLIEDAGAGGTPVELDIKGLDKYCDLKRTQYHCFYDSKSDGCKSADMKRLEQAERDGLDLIDVVGDLKRYIHARKPASSNPVSH